MRVIHVLGPATEASTALWRTIAPLVRAVRERDGAVEVWFLGAGGILEAAARDAGAQPRVISWSSRPRDVAGALRFARALSGARGAIVHQHYGARAVRLLARVAGAKTVVHLHGRFAGVDVAARARVHPHGAQAIVANSAATAEIVVGAPVAIAYPGIRLPAAIADVRRQPVRIGYVGRLSPEKGVDVLLEAFARAADRFPGTTLEIVGDGAERGRLESLAAARGLATRVTFAGWIADPPYARWQLFVQPSRDEGFGLATAEAMAAGLPVVASRVGGLVELVVDGETGSLVPADDASALAEAIAMLCASPDDRVRLAAAARQRIATTFTADRFVNTILPIYDALDRA